MNESPTPDKMLRVLLIDDHPFLRQGVAMTLESAGDIKICGEADTASAGIEAVRNLQPDVVVTDLTLPDKSGIDLTRILVAEHPDIPVLILSMHEEGLYAERCIRAGAKGYVMKSQGPKHLIDAVHTVANGRLYAGPELAQRLMALLSSSTPAKPERDGGLQLLSDREFEVFELVGRGHTAKEIGAMLGLSSKTVDVHRSRIRAKLDLATTPDLTHYAVRWVQAKDGGANL
jgi:DNA-binding NarL/FixJ family response regulator